jgi:hypothetical protein
MVTPEILSTISFILIILTMQCAYYWHLSFGDRPMILHSLGAMGDLLENVSYFVVMIAGISIIIWSFRELDWSTPIINYIGSLVFVIIISKSLPIRTILISAPVPLMAAIILVVLQWYTWFA